MYDKAIAAAAAQAPMGSKLEPIVRRVLLIDGDGLAYYCAGNDTTDAGEARDNVRRKIQGAARQVGAEIIKVLFTGSGSTKGDRYAIARVKAYQAQRSDSKRPKNWQHLRDWMLGSEFPYEAEVTYIAEADDWFGWYAYNYPDDVVIYTQDKDMRMLPGYHLDWVSHRLHRVTYELADCRDQLRMYNVKPHDSVFNDKQYGHKWFWLQMLHGDTADYIPGLPKYLNEKKVLKPCGEVTAGKLLADEAPPHLRVAELYYGYYQERWLVEMLEQACLLWMRRDPSKWDDCCDYGGPMHSFFNDAAFHPAYAEIEQRVNQARALNAQTKSE